MLGKKFFWPKSLVITIIIKKGQLVEHIFTLYSFKRFSFHINQWNPFISILHQNKRRLLEISNKRTEVLPASTSSFEISRKRSSFWNFFVRIKTCLAISRLPLFIRLHAKYIFIGDSKGKWKKKYKDNIFFSSTDWLTFYNMCPKWCIVSVVVCHLTNKSCVNLHHRLISISKARRSFAISYPVR